MLFEQRNGIIKNKYIGNVKYRQGSAVPGRSVQSMAGAKRLPVGFDDFKKIRENGFYYVDKTKLIEELLQNWGEVNLFTRPRRFGKTLNMSMLKIFFEIGMDKRLFEGLYISGKKELCEEYMGKYPVIFLSLKGIDGMSFEAARYRLIELIGVEAEQFAFLAESDQLTDNDRSRYRAIIKLVDGKYSMDEDILISSLQTLSQLLYRHYGQKTIVLLDEYDVPLDKAFQHGYYREMVSLIRGLFGQALKTNPSLQFAVLTGCLRVSKESIFTGLNNFKVYATDDVRYDEEFGFTNEEVEKLLGDYGMQEHFPEIDNSIENVWSVLFMTGYLTRTGNDQSDVYQLIIPNKEVREVFVLQIKDWFGRIVADSRASVEKINYGFLEGKTEDIQQELTMFLGETISILDTKARNDEKEIFYHGILSGILKNYSGWAVKSNKESGDGFADILLKPKNPDAGIIIELKYARSMNELDNACKRALEQIRERRYDAELREDGRSDILAYGIAFCKKRCKVVVEKL